MKYTIHRLKSVDSTNNTAFRIAEQGAAEGTVVIAEEQTAGRGRHGRNWTSPAGTGLYLSMILRPPKPPEQLWQLAFVTSLATAESIINVSGLSARIKWPNDLLINDRKVSGILVETKPMALNSSEQSATGKSNRSVVVLGIGVNVNTPSFPPELAVRATSLLLESASNSQIDMRAVEDELLSSIRSRYALYLESDFYCVLDEWRRLDCTSGRQVTVDTTEGTICGTAQGIDQDGDLIVKCLDGSISRLSSGEVILR